MYGVTVELVNSPHYQYVGAFWSSFFNIKHLIGPSVHEMVGEK